MVAPARKLAYQLLRRIESLKSFSDYALNSRAVGRLELRDRNLTTEIVYGTLRWRGLLDFILATAISRPLEGIDPNVRILLRMSLYQMCQMDRIPDHALVHDAVELCKQEVRSGVEKFVNAVLRRLSRERPWEDPEFSKLCPAWDSVSLPKWLWERWSQRFGSERARAYALSLNGPPRHAFRISATRRREASQVFESPESVVMSDLVSGAFLPPRGSHSEATARACGDLSIQDEASQLIPFLFGPLEGSHIWDVCAAPGGKSAILVELGGPQGWLVSTDLHFHRARRLRDFLARFSGSRSEVLVIDAASPAPFRCEFDAILVDTPCSGLGTLRRNPEAKWRILPQNLKSFQELQLRILHSAAASVRSGGRVIYSTCSTEPEENEEVVNSFLASNSGFRLVRPDSPAGVEHWLGPDLLLRTFPSTRLWDGFFAALLVRNK